MWRGMTGGLQAARQSRAGGTVWPVSSADAGLLRRPATSLQGCGENGASGCLRAVNRSIGHAVDYLDAHASDENPFFLYLNTAKLHQPNLPHPDFVGKSMAKSKYLDSLVELDHNVGVVVDKVRELGIAENTLIFWTTDNGAWQDVYPDCGYTPFRGTKGTDYEGGSRVPAIAWWPGTIEPGRRNSEIAGSLDFMATFASLAGLELPTEDCEASRRSSTAATRPRC